MRIHTKTAVLAALIGLAALPATAQPTAPRPEGPARGPARMFEEADTNRDGRVTWDEAWARLTARYNEADADRDGGVTPDELRAYVARQMGNRSVPARAENRGQALFRAADLDRDGRVSLAEFRPMAEAVFRSADGDGDGAIVRDELPGRHRDAPRPGPRGEATPSR